MVYSPIRAFECSRRKIFVTVTTFIENHEVLIRGVVAGTVMAVMIAWELLAPRRKQTIARHLRWPSNFGIAILNALVVRLVLPLAAVGFALFAETRNWGLFNISPIAPWLATLLGLLMLDLAIYFQHVLTHAVPALWRLHRMHHSDLEIDVSTGVRFHPLEIMLSMLFKLALVATLGLSAHCVLLFEVLLNGSSLFNHANVRMASNIDRILRIFIVTPDMHRVHHSVLGRETNSNFGFNLTWWDHLFGTYVAQPERGHERMLIGIAQFRTAEQSRLDRLLIQPFKGPAERPL
jgi:sterol desaturase/sphingolipid hydroxylase (fatty acid hydroxylase superfamily)